MPTKTIKKKKKVAILEDDKMLNKYLAASFAKEGTYDVCAALNGEEGIAMIKKEMPDLVLCDIIMPKKNGFEVLEAAKKDAKTKKIIFIMLSNLSQESDVKQAKKMGAKDFWLKVDFDTEAIVKKVKDILK
ncbi:MAG TPA: response regulator [Patescibacteria group bacterium]|nr:response regulator [Patescibacteria group bacterium]